MNGKKTKMDEVDDASTNSVTYFCTYDNKWVMETTTDNIHIGQCIKEQLKKDHRSVGWLSREIGCTRNHVYKIFNKPSLDSDLLLRISLAMNFNFFQYYTAEFKEHLARRIGEE